jgi:hypothetical protein
MEVEELLLHGARHGDIGVVRQLIDARKDEKVVFDLSCHGE